MKLTVKFISLLLCLFIFNASRAQLSIKITGIPDDTPLNDRIYLAGNFNDWNARDQSLSIEWKDPAQRTIRLNPSLGRLEFKFTRGDWASVEGDVNGLVLPNRVFEYDGSPQTLEVIIQSWEDLGSSSPESTAAPNVYLLEENFYMPQLNRSRRILIYLPYSYFSSEKRYPVLYMHDGQNLFDVKTSFSGEWEVDETLNRLIENGFPEVIVVGIDNGGGERLNEYTPYPNPQYGGGQGDAYVRFIAETLKPYIDENYRTMPGARQTGIMGSSLGGLISMYGQITQADVFGKGGVLSPSFWWSDQIYFQASQIDPGKKQIFYLLASARESDSMRGQMEAMYNTLRSAGVAEENIRLRITEDGAHSEWYWARELPAALTWLFRDTDVYQPYVPFEPVLMKPNSGVTKIRISGEEVSGELQAKLFDREGRALEDEPVIKGKKLKLPKGLEGAYFVNLYEGERLIGCLRLHP